MKILHFFRNAKRFFHDYPFYHYLLESDGLETAIVDFLSPGETVPRVHFKTPIHPASTDEDRLRVLKSFQPDILHCHHGSLLESVTTLSSQTGIPAVYSLYRQDLKASTVADLLAVRELPLLKGIFLPFSSLFEDLRNRDYKGHTAVLAEVPGSAYAFKSMAMRTGERKTFAALISEKDEPYIQNIHRSLEKILVTNHTLNIAWVLLAEECEKAIRADLAGRKISEFVRLVRLHDFPMLGYDGLVTDGNLNHCLSDSQYFHLLFSCLTQGKLLITYPEEGMEDILMDGQTCFIVSRSTTKLSHLIHFLINFQDEMSALVARAKTYCQENYSRPVMQERLTSVYKQITGKA